MSCNDPYIDPYDGLRNVDWPYEEDDDDEEYGPTGWYDFDDPEEDDEPVEGVRYGADKRLEAEADRFLRGNGFDVNGCKLI